MAIKNIVFDIGNVLVKWDPHAVIQSIFPECDPVKMYEDMRPLWIDLNLGKLAEKEAILLYKNQLHVSEQKIYQLMEKLKTSQTPIPGSIELLQKLHIKGIPLYSITDNVKEIIQYHRTHSNFLQYFRGVVVSADIGILKPNKGIFQHLLTQYKLHPEETVFIDDIEANVEAALSIGMHAFQFTDTKSCEKKLIALGINIEKSDF